MKGIIGIVVIGALVLGGAYWYNSTHNLLPYYSFNTSTNQVIASDMPTFTVGDFTFTDQQGRTITEKDVHNTVFVVDYFFVECPGICKQMSNELERVYAAFENNTDLKILSHTAKPDEDSTAALMMYAQMHKVKNHDKWLFLTGDKKALYQMAREQYFIVNDEGDGGEDDFIHTERFALMDKNRHIRGYYDGTNTKDVNKLIKDIQSLLDE